MFICMVAILGEKYKIFCPLYKSPVLKILFFFFTSFLLIFKFSFFDSLYVSNTSSFYLIVSCNRKAFSRDLKSIFFYMYHLIRSGKNLILELFVFCFVLFVFLHCVFAAVLNLRDQVG